MTNPYRALCAELTDAELANAARKALGEPSYATELPYFLSEDSSEYEPLMLVVRAAIAADRARALLAQPVAEGPEGSYFTDGDYNREIHYAWELEDAEGEWQAGGSSNRLDDVRREGSHYLQTYSQDGPHKLIIQRHCVSTIEEVTND